MMDDYPLLQFFEQEHGYVIGRIDPVPNDLERGIQSIDDIELCPGSPFLGKISDGDPGALPGVLWDTKKLFTAGDHSPDNVIEVMLLNDIVTAMPT
jgi:hypothetical protein